MDKFEAFRILRIAQTKDEKIIKQAYRERLSATNPEDDPEGFKQLRLAYEAACRFASEQDSPAAEQNEEDTTPSGIWLSKAKSIYNRMECRRDTKAWESLFEDDIFISLEEEENCQTKLLIFLMDHFKLPSAVWKLLDDRMKLVRNASALREKFPPEYIAYIVRQCEGVSEFFYDDFSIVENGDYDAFLDLYDQCVGALNEDCSSEAEALLRQADETGITHPSMEFARALYYDKCGETDKAETLLKEITERYPDRAVYQAQAGEYFWKRGEEFHDLAGEYFARTKELEDKHYTANLRLTQYYYDCKKYKEAKKCAERIIALGAEDAFFDLLQDINLHLEMEYEDKWYFEQDWASGLELAWCYLQDGRLSEGERIAKALEKGLPEEKEAEWKGLLAKYSLEECLYEQAAAQALVWEEALKRRIQKEEGLEKERDIDRIRQSHMIRTQCFYHLGYKDETYFPKAIDEAESILLGGVKDINILMEMTQIYTEMGEYDKALDVCDKLIRDFGVLAAHSLKMEVGRRLLDAHMVIQSGSVCIHEFPSFEKAYEYMAKVYLDLKHPEHMQELVEIAAKNEIYSDLLDSYVFLQEQEQMDSDELSDKCREFRDQYRSPLEKGHIEKYEEGLPVITAYLKSSPEAYMFVERGIFHRFGSHFDEAEKDLNKALQINPINVYALNALSFVYKYRGEFDKAIGCLTRVILYKDDSFTDVVYSDIAELYCLTGDFEQALRFARLYEEKTGETARWFYNQLADIYIHLRDGRKACEYICKGRDEDELSVLDRCVDACLKCGDEAMTRAYLARWAMKLGIKESADSLRDRMKKIFKESEKEEKNTSTTAQLVDYYKQLMWAELNLGTKFAAGSGIKKILSFSDTKLSEGALADLIFGCILTEEDELGKKASALLGRWLEAYDRNPLKTYHYRGKGLLQLRILAGWYTNDIKALNELMAQEPEAELCHFCTSCVCRELDSLRILLMLREGKKQEAEQYTKKCLRRQPSDEFIQAINRQMFV